MNLIDYSIQYLKNIEPKYYIVFSLGYIAGWLLTWKIVLCVLAICAILVYSSIIHKNKQTPE